MHPSHKVNTHKRSYWPRLQRWLVVQNRHSRLTVFMFNLSNCAETLPAQHIKRSCLNIQNLHTPITSLMKLYSLESPSEQARPHFHELTSPYSTSICSGLLHLRWDWLNHSRHLLCVVQRFLKNQPHRNSTCHQFSTLECASLLKTEYLLINFSTLSLSSIRQVCKPSLRARNMITNLVTSLPYVTAYPPTIASTAPNLLFVSTHHPEWRKNSLKVQRKHNIIRQ